MKAIVYCVVVGLLIQANGFSQVQTKPKTQTLNPVLRSNVVLKEPVSKPSATGGSGPAKIDSAAGILSGASFTVATANSYTQMPGTNKAKDTHWSCSLFDQDGNEVASFRDQSNSDEYISGSVTPSLAMHIDKAISYGDFSKGGRLHIQILPQGNDSWMISTFDANLEFSNPNFSRKLSWTSIQLSQDNKTVDLNFNVAPDGTLKYDVKKNTKIR